MNTCAQCRFWSGTRTTDDRWRQCLRPAADGSRISSDHVVTRSDFGCVQFEAKTILDQVAKAVSDALPGVSVRVDDGVNAGTYQYPHVRIEEK
jgi:hypothetical protein